MAVITRRLTNTAMAEGQGEGERMGIDVPLRAIDSFDDVSVTCGLDNGDGNS